jgi:hypothetical protein
MGLFDSIGSSLGIGVNVGRDSSTSSGTRTTQKMLSQEGIDKIVYDILSSDQGLAALSSAENASGGYGSSSKTLLAQDLIAKVAGEIANITAPTVETSNQKTVNKKASAKTVICTHLAERGYIPITLYLRGMFHTLQLPIETRVGYLSWAERLVPILARNPWLCRLIAPIVLSRYKLIVEGKFGILGALTVYVGQPLCFILGAFIIAFGKDQPNGYLNV